MRLVRAFLASQLRVNRFIAPSPMIVSISFSVLSGLLAVSRKGVIDMVGLHEIVKNVMYSHKVTITTFWYFN